MTSEERRLKGDIKPAKVLTVFTLVMITTGIITSIHNAPSLAEFGFSLVFVYLVVAIVFLMPSALISAELATGWPADGGVYVWVREAFGDRWGFVAVWQQWAENAIWFPSILSVVVITVAYAWDPNLQNNKWYVFIGVNVVFWALTLLNLFGMRTSAAFATVGTLLGRVFPILFIAGLAVAFVTRGDQSQIEFSVSTFLPNFGDTGTLVFIVAAFLTFAGIEASANEAAAAKNPRRDYPIAIMVSAGIALVLVTLVALSLAIVIPQNDISLVAGFMQAVQNMLEVFNIGWLLPVAAIIIAIGMLGEINNWIPAPTRGLFVAARHGNLPPAFRSVNSRGVHYAILVGQGVFVTFFSTLTLLFQIQSAYWILTILPTQLYLIMYFLMFAAGVKLRYSHPEVPRRYRIPLGNFGIWALATIGCVAGLAAIVVAFVPPETMPDSERRAFYLVEFIGFATLFVLPILIHVLRRPAWKLDEEEDHEPVTTSTNAPSTKG